MWISKRVERLLEDERIAYIETQAELSKTQGENTRLQIENARLRSDMDWFKHRLNGVERERGQLIQAAIGVKVSIPEFVPTHENPQDALYQMPDLSHVGGDAAEETEPDPEAQMLGVDYSILPGYNRGPK